MEQKQFVREIAQKFRAGMCDLFVGAGISAPSNLPTWRDFLQPYLADMGLQLHMEDDLPLLAQYIVNENAGNKNIISEAVFRVFGKEYPLNPYHAAIADLPVKTIWTTNYDSLLEKAFADRKFRVIASEDAFLHPHDMAELEIIKLHGCAKTAAQGIVLTRADYDCFLYDKPKLAQHLREALVERSIFFLGYSYQDPDIHAVVTQVYQMMRRMTHVHYMLIDEPEQRKDEPEADFQERKQRFQYWTSELRRIGICELVVPRKKIADVLKRIAQEARGNTVFVTGGHEADGKLVEYAKKVGSILAEIPSVILNSGQSAGIGSAALASFLEYVIKNKEDINRRIHVFPNPYAVSPEYGKDMSLLPALKQARAPLIADSAFVILFAGGFGTKAEVELACARGRKVLPVVQKNTDYNTEAMQYVLKNDSNNEWMEERVGFYCNQLKRQEIPSEEDTIKAIRKILDGKA